MIAGSDKEKIYTWMVPANLSIPKGGGDGTSSEWNNGNRVQMAQMPYQTISSCHPGIEIDVLFNRKLNCLYSSGVKKDIVLQTPHRLGFEGENNQDPLTKESENTSLFFCRCLLQRLNSPGFATAIFCQISSSDKIELENDIRNPLAIFLANRSRSSCGTG